MAHFAALWHCKSRTALVLLHEQLRIAEIAADRRALVIIARCHFRDVLSRLRQIQGRIRLDLGALRGRRRSGVDFHFRFHVHTGRLIFRSRRQAVPMLPEVLLRVAQKRTEHIRVPNTHRAHRIRPALCDSLSYINI